MRKNKEAKNQVIFYSSHITSFNTVKHDKKEQSNKVGNVGFQSTTS